MKDEILSLLTMKDILNKYGIKQKGNMFNCPFHGEDKHPSAKAYKNSYYCFTCNKTGDIIGFVENYFNISFLEAMQKINIDFLLGLNLKNKIDYSKIKEHQKNKNKILIKTKQKKIQYMILSERYRKIRNEVLEMKKNINILNWESQEKEISKKVDRLELIDYELEKIFNSL